MKVRNIERFSLKMVRCKARVLPHYIRVIQRTFYDLLAMIRQLGTPTWFFTLSAADIKWPDMIQTIARQYGVYYTDDDVALR